MAVCPLLIHFNGIWGPNNLFQDYVTEGIVISDQCTFDLFYNVLATQLKINNDTLLKIQFQLMEGLAPMNINNDMNLSFYMQMRNGGSNVMHYPLCITMEEKTASKATTDEELHIQNEEESEFPIQPVQEGPVDFIDYVHHSTHHIMEHLDNPFKKEDELLQERDVTLISDKRFKNFQEGQIFIDKATLQSALSFYAIEERFQFKTERSSHKHYFLKCVDKECHWSFRATKYGKSSAFKIKKYVETHSCSLHIRFSGKRQATRNLIGEMIKMKYAEVNSNYTPRDIIQDMRLSYGVSVNYQKAWNSKEKALEMVRGKPSDSYGVLPSYLYMLQQTNPGTIVDLKKEANNAFLYVFVAFEASIKGWRYCRPTVVVDGTFLKAAHRGTLITACTQDASGAIFPLAFCVVDSENDSSWAWFFTKFREVYKIRDGMAFVSDRHESIAKGLQLVYPETHHYACIYHLKGNLRTKFRKDTKKIGTYFMQAAKSYTEAEFEINMSQLDSVDKEVRSYLTNIGLERWARCYQHTNRSYNLTSNIAESLNAVNRVARELPITALLEQLRDLTQEWFVKNRLVAQSTFTKLTKRHEDSMMKNYIEAEKYEVKESNHDVYKVSASEDVYVVNMGKRTCTCNRFQIDEIPCGHALAVISKKHIDPYEFCAEYFTKTAMLATYECSIFPIPKQDTWKIPDEVKGVIVYPPIGRNKAGRPKKRRFRSAWETKTRTQCSTCGKRGHNRKTCRSSKASSSKNV